MDETGPLCKLSMIEASYDMRNINEGDAGHLFEVKITSEHKEIHFEIPARSGELFAAELDVLASIIRARVIRARLRVE